MFFQLTQLGFVEFRFWDVDVLTIGKESKFNDNFFRETDTNTHLMLGLFVSLLAAACNQLLVWTVGLSIFTFCNFLLALNVVSQVFSRQEKIKIIASLWVEYNKRARLEPPEPTFPVLRLLKSCNALSPISDVCVS